MENNFIDKNSKEQVDSILIQLMVVKNKTIALESKFKGSIEKCKRIQTILDEAINLTNKL